MDTAVNVFEFVDEYVCTTVVVVYLCIKVKHARRVGVGTVHACDWQPVGVDL